MWLSNVQSYVNLSVAEFHTHRSLFSMTPSPEGNARSSPFLSKGILLMWPSRPILPVSIHTVLVPIQPFDNRLDERRWFFLLPHHLLNRSGTFRCGFLYADPDLLSSLYSVNIFREVSQGIDWDFGVDVIWIVVRNICIVVI